MSQQSNSGELVRALDWKGAFWVAAGVPPLVLFSIGGIAGTTGKLAFLVWMISMVMGFLQSFTYAEIAGMFANKSGGASVYGATAWLRYSKFIAPLSVWCNWFAWSPVLSLDGSPVTAIPRLAQRHPPARLGQGFSRGKWPSADSLESLRATPSQIGQFHLLTRRQIKPGGTPKRSFAPGSPKVRFAPKAVIRRR